MTVGHDRRWQWATALNRHHLGVGHHGASQATGETALELVVVLEVPLSAGVADEPAPLPHQRHRPDLALSLKPELAVIPWTWRRITGGRCHAPLVPPADYARSSTGMSMGRGYCSAQASARAEHPVVVGGQQEMRAG